MGELLIVFYLGQGLVFHENINLQKLNFVAWHMEAEDLKIWKLLWRHRLHWNEIRLHPRILEGISYLEDFSGSRGDDPEHFGLHHVLATVANSCLDLHLEWNFSKNRFVQMILVLDNFTKNLG